MLIGKASSHTCRHAVMWSVLPVTLILTGCWSYVVREAAQTFQHRKSAFTVTVYPVNVVKRDNVGCDKNLARTVASFLEEQGLAAPTLGNRDFTYAFQWGANQAAMAERSAKAFAAQVKADNIGTDYALLVEVLMWGDGRTVGGVEFYLCDKAGSLADGSLRNSDWGDFQKINPTTPEGGVEVAKSMLKQAWGQQKK
jgi:hypothetical protein